MTSTGKSRAFINDTPVAISQLKEIGESIIDIHSQHQNLLLRKENFQLNVLDILANNICCLNAYAEKYQHYKSVSKQLADAIEAAKYNHDEEDYVRFQVNQLVEADLKENEQTELEEIQEMLSHAEEIRENLYIANNLLTSDEGNDTLHNIKQCCAYLQCIAHVFSPADELIHRLDSCYIELKDVSDEITDKADRIENDPQHLEQVNDRLNLIYTLQKKHHVDTVEKLIQLRSELEAKLVLIDNSDEHIIALKQEKADAFDAVMTEARKLSYTRQKAKKQLEVDIVNLLIPLGMPNVKFVVELMDKSEPDQSGTDKVAFMFSANKNIPIQPLSQIASGGEIARVMLCLKALIAGAVKLPTIIFDEIDTGASGSIAEKMALIMQDMGNNGHQVISITHLPQIAALGKYHYRVYKEESLFATSTHIAELNPYQRIEEIAHMLSGSTITDAAMNNARELLKL